MLHQLHNENNDYKKKAIKVLFENINNIMIDSNEHKDTLNKIITFFEKKSLFTEQDNECHFIGTFKIPEEINNAKLTEKYKMDKIATIIAKKLYLNYTAVKIESSFNPSSVKVSIQTNAIAHYVEIYASKLREEHTSKKYKTEALKEFSQKIENIMAKFKESSMQYKEQKAYLAELTSNFSQNNVQVKYLIGRFCINDDKQLVQKINEATKYLSDTGSIGVFKKTRRNTVIQDTIANQLQLNSCDMQLEDSRDPAFVKVYLQSNAIQNYLEKYINNKIEEETLLEINPSFEILQNNIHKIMTVDRNNQQEITGYHKGLENIKSMIIKNINSPWYENYIGKFHIDEILKQQIDEEIKDLPGTNFENEGTYYANYYMDFGDNPKKEKRDEIIKFLIAKKLNLKPDGVIIQNKEYCATANVHVYLTEEAFDNIKKPIYSEKNFSLTDICLFKVKKMIRDQYITEEAIKTTIPSDLFDKL